MILVNRGFPVLETLVVGMVAVMVTVAGMVLVLVVAAVLGVVVEEHDSWDFLIP